MQVLNSGAPGSLIGALYGTDKIKRLSYNVPLRDSGPIRSSTGSYPWRVDEDYTTIVNITNISDHSASFIVDIRYPTGHYFLQVKDVAANGTSTFDLRKLISEQKPDNQGNVIPLSTTGGQFHWSIFGSPTSSKFIGRSEVVSVSNHVSSSYSCPACCPESGPFGQIIVPDPIGVGGSETLQTTGTVYDCNNYPTNIGALPVDEWGIDDPSIASYSPDYGGSTVVQGLSAGEAFISASWPTDIWTSDGWSMCFESRDDMTDSEPMQVQCTSPTSETTTPIGWDSDPTVYSWDQTLLPAATNFTGRTVTEQDPGGGGPDTCHFTGSIFTPFTAITGGTWTVTSGNHWGSDHVGWHSSAVTYYRAQGKAPCGTTFPQRMVIDCSTGPITYATNTLGCDINSTTVTSTRAGSMAIRTWP